MSFIITLLEDLAVGDIIYVEVHNDIADVDMAPVNHGQEVRQSISYLNDILNSLPRIVKGDPVTRLAVILIAGSSSVIVTYFATFAKSTSPPTTFTDKTLWYPVAPATKESDYDPLPALPNNTAQRASLHTKQTITESPVGSLFPPCLDNIFNTLWIWYRRNRWRAPA